MATFKYFADINGEAVEVKPESVHTEGRKALGTPVNFTPVWKGDHWDRGLVEVTRSVRMKANPSKHECDARCMFAKGRTMNCECACGGKNHGRGGFSAVAV